MRALKIISAIPLTPHLHDQLQIEHAQKSGISVEFVDLSMFYFGKKSMPAPTNHKAFANVNILKIPSIKDFARYCEKIPETSIVVFVEGWSSLSIPIWRILSKGNFKIAAAVTDPIPILSEQKSRSTLKKTAQRLHKILNLLISDPSRLVMTLMEFLPPKMRGCRTLDIVLLGGGTATELWHQKLVGSATRKVSGPSNDYVIYKKMQSNPEQTPRHIVFIDQSLANHADFALLGLPQPVSMEKYYRALCELFSHWENSLGLPVVIAAHPKGSYPKHSDFFGGRKILHGKTSVLIAQSLFAATHYSTAVNLAVLCNKPIIILTSDELNRSPLFNLMKALAVSLKCAVINIDHDQIETPSTSIDAKAYATFCDTYIKSPKCNSENVWLSLFYELGQR